jgi:hypothetical protein
MPVILNPRDYDLWLDPSIQDGKRLEPVLVPYPSEALAAYPVTTPVNNPKADDPKCIAPMGYLCGPRRWPTRRPLRRSGSGRPDGDCSGRR